MTPSPWAQQLFLYIVPNNFTVGTGPKVRCGRGMSIKLSRVRNSMRLLDTHSSLDYNLYRGSLVMDSMSGNVGNTVCITLLYFTIITLWTTGPMKLTDCWLVFHLQHLQYIWVMGETTVYSPQRPQWLTGVPETTWNVCDLIMLFRCRIWI